MSNFLRTAALAIGPPALMFTATTLASAQGEPQNSPQQPAVSASSQPDTDTVAKRDPNPNFHTCKMPDNKTFIAVVGLTVTAAGLPEQVSLLQTSGNPCLDDSALTAARDTTFFPATHKGEPVAQHLILPVHLVRYDAKHTSSTASSSGTTPPRVRRTVQVDTEACKHSPNTEFSTLVAFTVDTDGKPQRVSISSSSGDPGFDEAALKAVSGYLYTPAQRNGASVSVSMKIRVNGLCG
jgi:TonB family protein